MQINSIWLSKIASYGYSQYDLQFDVCKNINVGAWILSQSLAAGRTAWERIGRYHSITKSLNKKYSQQIEKFYHYFQTQTG